MGVIIDEGIQHQIDALEAKGNFELAGQLRAANEVGLGALAFRTSVPPKFQALVRNAADDQIANKEREEKRQREREHEREAEAAYQRMIDSQIVKLRIGGEDVEISQGELRKAMENRVAALKERKRQLEESGGDPKEIKRVGNLIDEYEPVIDKTKHGRADAQTLDEIQRLDEKDPELRTEIKLEKAANSPTQNRRTSYAADRLGEGALSGPSLKNKFEMATAAESAPPSPSAQAKGPDARQKADAKFQSLDF